MSSPAPGTDEHNATSTGSTGSMSRKATDAAIAPGGHLQPNMLLFGRLLRAGGIDVTPDGMGDWMRSITLIDLERADDFRAATRSLLVHREADRAWFEAAYDLFWRARDPRQLQELELGLLVQETRRKVERYGAPVLARDDAPQASPDSPPRPSATWSVSESLRTKDFADLSANELAEMERVISGLRWRLDERRTRRRVRGKGNEIDARATLRRHLRTAGEFARIERRKRKTRRRPLVLLCDVSGSMEPYSRLLLRFLYAISHRDAARRGADRIEAFAFGTRLTRITRELQEKDPDRALSAATRRIQDWGGGTKTGESLEAFNRLWSRRVLGGGAVVLIMSDGWDRGDIPLLDREMARLARSCHRLVWLNPLLGAPGYEPLTRGMQAALPHLDEFLPVHNLRSLEQLGKLLAVRDRRQGGSRQRPGTHRTKATPAGRAMQ